MHRLACVDLPALPLQLLLRQYPQWKTLPTAVVDCDKPQGRILSVNKAARSSKILPGMRYCSALSLCGELRAAEVPSADIQQAVEEIVDQLRQFTPGVEPADDEPGVFWLNASGLGLLYESLFEWASLIHRTLRDNKRVDSTVIVGFTKFNTYAVAKSHTEIVTFKRPEEEHGAAQSVLLEALNLSPSVRGTLEKLGVRTVGDFVNLPTDGIEKRFGEEVRRLYRLARGDLQIPFSPSLPEDPLQQHASFDRAESNLHRLLILIGRLLHPLLQRLEKRGQALVEVRLDLRFEYGKERIEKLRPAAPTNDLTQIIDLLHLRLDRGDRSFVANSSVASDGVTDASVTVRGGKTKRAQLDLFSEAPPRNSSAANRALARLRAELGETAIVRPRQSDGHLPEALFSWEPLREIQPAKPRDVECGALVRRIYTRPILLPARPRHEPDGWLLRGLEQGPVTRVLGPYIVSGAWWRQSIHREYHFAETQKGELLWTYYDRLRRRWFIQGRVE